MKSLWWNLEWNLKFDQVRCKIQFYDKEHYIRYSGRSWAGDNGCVFV